MSRILFVAAGAAALISAPANASPPTMRKCAIDTDSGPFLVNVTVDEANGFATVHLPHSGFIQRRPAIFSADLVKFSTSSVEYTLGRTDLAIRRRFSIGGADSGKCVIEKTIPRKF